MEATLRNLFGDGDSVMRNYPLMKTPLPVAGILASYILFVLKIGPAAMKNRQAFKLNTLIRLYNILQIFANGALCVLLFLELPTKNFLCTPIETALTSDALWFAHLQYAYVVIKILDLLDTVFFVLRKKSNQISFLHLYHHIMMVVSSWIYTKYIRGGQSFYMGLINTFVHFVMYYYYFLTSSSDTQQHIWWKKHITQLQLVQHCFVLTAYATALFNTNCSFPKPIAAFGAIQAVIMIKMFSSFYMKSYLNKTKTNGLKCN